MKWNDRSSKAFSYLTTPGTAPRVVRMSKRTAESVADTSGERPSDRILRLAESQGWELHNDPQLLDLLASFDVESQVPTKLNELIAEVIFFCWEIDVEGSK